MRVLVKHWRVGVNGPHGVEMLHENVIAVDITTFNEGPERPGQSLGMLVKTASATEPDHYYDVKGIISCVVLEDADDSDEKSAPDA